MKTERFLLTVALTILSLSILGGCSSTKITEYEDDKIIKVTETETSIVSSITDSTKNKSVFNWTTLFGFDLELIMLPVKEMSPRVHLRLGKITNGTMSILSGQVNLDDIPPIIDATSGSQTLNKEGYTSK